jgi:hypothetical protein
MTEFADIFAYDLTTAVYLVSSMAILAMAAAAAAAMWTSREPAPAASFAPARSF